MRAASRSPLRCLDEATECRPNCMLNTLSDESRLALAAKVSQGALMASLFAALIAAQWPP